MSLPPCILDDLELGIATRQLLDPGHHDLEIDAKLAKNLTPLGRPRCEGDLQDSSGNQIEISRSAYSSESDPWTMLKVTSSA